MLMAAKIRAFKNIDNVGKPVEYVIIITTYHPRFLFPNKYKRRTQVITGETIKELQVKSALHFNNGLLEDATVQLRPAYDLRYIKGKKLKAAPLGKDEANALFR